MYIKKPLWWLILHGPFEWTQLIRPYSWYVLLICSLSWFPSSQASLIIIFETSGITLYTEQIESQLQLSTYVCSNWDGFWFIEYTVSPQCIVLNKLFIKHISFHKSFLQVLFCEGDWLNGICVCLQYKWTEGSVSCSCHPQREEHSPHYLFLVRTLIYCYVHLQWMMIHTVCAC